MRTFRRDRLWRLAKAGKLVCVSSYSFDDGYGASSSKREMPVKALVNGDTYRPEGVVCLREDHFTGYGGATEEGGVIHLHVHSNLNFDFRVIS